jgi:hypothetical protein
MEKTPQIGPTNIKELCKDYNIGNENGLFEDIKDGLR